MKEKTMIKKIILSGQEIECTLTRKPVKNINLRVKQSGEIFVSANRFVPVGRIEKFIRDNENFILKAIKKYADTEKTPLTQYFSEKEIRTVITDLCQKVYPYYEKMGIAFPVIKFRKMVSQWGNCRNREGILTFNTNLIYAPIECIEYVVLHEFTHFIEANHSARFYAELEKVCPDWKERRNFMKNIKLRS